MDNFSAYSKGKKMGMRGRTPLAADMRDNKARLEDK